MPQLKALKKMHKRSNSKRYILSMSYMFSLFFFIQGFAENVIPQKQSSYHWRPVAILTSGVMFNPSGNQANFFPANASIFSYYNYFGNQNNQTVALYGGSLGIEWPITSQLFLQTDISYGYPESFNLTGTVTQGVDTESESQYRYQYKIQNQQLLFEAKLFYNLENYNPYLTVGMGNAWNKAYDYNVSIQPPFTTFSNQFSDQSYASFTYDLGFGVDVSVLEYARIGIGYRFINLGQAITGPGVIDTVATSYRLSQPHLYANQLLAQLTIVIN